MSLKSVPLDLAGDYTSVSVAASGWTTIFEVPEFEAEKMRHFEFYCTPATNNLDQFEVQFKAHPDAEYVTIYNTTAGFTTAIAGPLDYCTVDPTTLTAAATCMMKFKDLNVAALRIRASASGGAATVTSYGRVIRWN